MENWFTKMAVLTARFIVVGFVTLVYVAPLYMLFYLIIVQDVELSSEISQKFFLISYLIGFVINYVNMVSSPKKDEKSVNKGV